MNQPFATVDDIQRLYRPLSSTEQSRAEDLLPLVSDEIRTLGKQYGKDIDEAIAQINFIGSTYSASIFTDDEKNASKFINNIKSKSTLVNTSPTLERKLDIKQTDLILIKNIVIASNMKVNINLINESISEI